MEKHKDGKPTGLKQVRKMCGIQVLVNEIPMIRGSVEGAQQASEESRNRAEETKGVVSHFGFACQHALDKIATVAKTKRLT